MADRPIIFSDAMVRAILDGGKTQTRRVIKPQPTGANMTWADVDRRRMPEIGDRLWVREAWNASQTAEGCIAYRATDAPPPHVGKVKWRSPIHMPRWASRITLTVKNVRVQRVQEISEGDAWAEGVQARGCTRWESEGRDRFAGLWEQIHGEGAWDANPWVAAITFTAEARNIDAETQAP